MEVIISKLELASCKMLIFQQVYAALKAAMSPALSEIPKTENGNHILQDLFFVFFQ